MNKTNKIKYFIYARKSSETEDRQINSINDQLEILNDFAVKNDLEIIDTLQESASAKKPGRVAFNEMIQRMNNGEADGILTWKLNRLARNPVDGGSISWALQNSVIQRIITPERVYNTSDNIIMMQLEFGMSNQFIIDLRKDSRRGSLKKAENGWLPSRAPLGYLNAGEIQGKKYIKKDLERFDLVRKMWDMALEEIPLVKIAEIVQDEWGLRNRKMRKSGGTIISKTQIYAMFSNLFYTGKFEYWGKTYQGKHPAMVTIEEFEKVQVILKRKNKPRPSKHKFAYTGIMKCSCGCGSMITAYKKKEKYIYYMPTGRKKDAPKCNQPQISEAKLEKQILEKLGEVEIRQEFLDWAFQEIDNNAQNDIKNKEDAEKNKTKTIESKKEELQRIKEMMRKGFYDSDEEFLSDRKKVQKEIEILEEKKYDEKVILQKAESLKDEFRFYSKAKSIVENSNNVDEKNKILSQIGRNHIFINGEFTMVVEPYFKKVQSYYKKIEKNNSRIELSNKAKKDRKNNACGTVSSKIISQSPNWGGYPELNRGCRYHKPK